MPASVECGPGLLRERDQTVTGQAATRIGGKAARGLFARPWSRSAPVHVRGLQEQATEQVSETEEYEDHDRHDGGDQAHHLEEL